MSNIYWSEALYAFIQSNQPDGSYGLHWPKEGDIQIVYPNQKGGKDIIVPFPNGDRVIAPPRVSWVVADGGHDYPLPPEYEAGYTPPYLWWRLGLKSELAAEMRQVRDELNTLLGE